MTIERLREIAKYHEEIAFAAEWNRAAASAEKIHETAATFKAQSVRHREIAKDLKQLADAFAALSPLRTSAK